MPAVAVQELLCPGTDNASSPLYTYWNCWHYSYTMNEWQTDFSLHQSFLNTVKMHVFSIYHIPYPSLIFVNPSLTCIHCQEMQKRPKLHTFLYFKYTRYSTNKTIQHKTNISVYIIYKSLTDYSLNCMRLFTYVNNSKAYNLYTKAYNLYTIHFWKMPVQTIITTATHTYAWKAIIYLFRFFFECHPSSSQRARF